MRGLRKSFGTKEAVAGIDPEIAVVPSPVLSANGAGKTMSLSMMTGLLRPDAGQVLINGVDVWADPPAVRGDSTAHPRWPACSSASPWLIKLGIRAALDRIAVGYAMPA